MEKDAKFSGEYDCQACVLGFGRRDCACAVRTVWAYRPLNILSSTQNLFRDIQMPDYFLNEVDRYLLPLPK